MDESHEEEETIIAEDINDVSIIVDAVSYTHLTLPTIYSV